MVSKRIELTIILINQNLASCRNTLSGLKIKASMSTTRPRGLAYGGILRLLLYKKLSRLRVQITPRTAASSIRCCSDRWFLGSNSKISTWFTPEDLQPYTFTPIRNTISIKSKGPLYRRNATFRSSPPPLWNIAKMKKKKYLSLL